MRRWPLPLLVLLLLASCLLAVGCKDSGAASAETAQNRRAGPPGGGSSNGGFGGFGGAPQTAVPVEVAAVVRRPISSYLETNGTLEAENDVDLVARVAGPVTELKVEEGMRVQKGQLLARIDPDEVRARMEISRVNRDEAKRAFERAEELYKNELLSREAYDQARSTYESAEAQLRGDQLVFGYTEITAPFAGVISVRYVKHAQYVGLNQPLFRVTSFDPLLCPIQIPERELSRLRLGQSAYVTVEAFRGERFPASVLRISPVISATTGTVKVTLEVSAQGKLRPGMFASVFLETETRPDALVIPKAALSLESIGDTVYVAGDGTASRREVKLGFQEGDSVEVRQGVAEGERVIVVGQDGLSDGTPIQILAGPGSAPPAEAAGGPPNMTPEQLEGMKQRMRERGMSDEQIEERLKSMRERAGRNPP